MEASPATNPKSTDSGISSSSSQASLPPRDNRKKRGTDKRAYYKTDVSSGGEENGQHRDSNSEASSAERSTQRSNGQRNGNRPEKVYQPKNGTPAVDSNNSAPQSPKDNGKAKRTRSRVGNQTKEDGANKKNNQKSNQHENQREGSTERHGNGPSEVKDPHRAQKVAEAARIQQIIPNGITADIEEKVKRIQEVVGKDQEFHVIFGVLEDEGYDVERTIAYFVERSDPDSQKKQASKMAPIGTATHWASIVKKGIKSNHPEEPPVEESTRVAPSQRGNRNKSPPPQANHPQANHPQANHPQASHPQANHPQANHPQANHPQANHPQANHPQASHPQVNHPQANHPQQQANHPQQPSHSQVNHPQQVIHSPQHPQQASHPNLHRPQHYPQDPNSQSNRSPVLEGMLLHPQPVDPEEIVSNLSTAIATQLKMIQEQTRMLTMMQTELSSITQTGSSERETLLNEKEMAQMKEADLLQQLNSVRQRITELDHLLEENQKKKAERISAITSNGVVASLLNSGTMVPSMNRAPGNF